MTAVWNLRAGNLWDRNPAALRDSPSLSEILQQLAEGHGEGEAAGKEERPAWKAEEGRWDEDDAAILEDYAQQMREEGCEGAAARKDEAWQSGWGRFMGPSDDYGGVEGGPGAETGTCILIHGGVTLETDRRWS